MRANDPSGGSGAARVCERSPRAPLSFTSDAAWSSASVRLGAIPACPSQASLRHFGSHVLSWQRVSSP
jgi:hypothetical protein